MAASMPAIDGSAAPRMSFTLRARLPSWSSAIAWSSATIAAQSSCGPDDAGGAVGAACCIGIAGMLGGPLHLLDARHPLLEVGVRVVVPKPNIRRRVAQVPRLVIAAVEPHHRQLARGHLMQRGHARVVALRRVDCHVWNVARAKESKRAVEMTRVQPFDLPELNSDLKPVHALLDL